MASKCITAGSHDDWRIGRTELTNSMPGPILLPQSCKIRLVALGWKHGHIVIDNNCLYSWGTGKSHRLGTENKMDSEIPIKINSIPPNFEFKMIQCGDAFSAAISKSGELLAWGHKYGHKPTKVELPSPAKYLSCGTTAICCALEDGSVVCFDESITDKKIHRIPGEKIIMTATGKSHFLALAASGNVYSWGSEYCGPKGEQSSPTLLEVTSSSSVKVTALYAYQNNSWFVDQNNDVYCFGRNDDGCLGNDSSSSVSSPQKVLFNFNGRVVQIACGDNITVVLNDKGVAYAAGNNKENRIAVSSRGQTKTFKKCELGIPTGGKITQVACGCYSSAFIINGDPPPSAAFSRPYKYFSISTTPATYYTTTGQQIKVSPQPQAIEAYGFQLEDIIRFPDMTSAKIIGLTESKKVVAITSNLSFRVIDSRDFDEILTTITLRERKDHRLYSTQFNGNKKIQLDISDSELFKFHGLKTQDKLEDNLRVCGVRGSTIFCNSDDLLNITKLASLSKYKTVERKNKTLCLKKFDNGNDYFVDIDVASSDHALRFDEIYGVARFVGKVHSHFCFEFLGNSGLLTLFDHDLQIVRDEQNGARTIDAFVNNQGSYEPISLSIAPLNELYPYDYVQTSKGFGTIAGFSDGKVAVYPEGSVAFRGAVLLFDPSDVTPKCRFFAPLQINSIEANAEALDDYKLYPSDEIELEGHQMTVIGIKEGKVYADENGKILEIDWKKAKLLKRHIPYRSLRVNQDLSYYCTAFNPISTKVVPYGEKTSYGTILGVTKHSTLLVQNRNSNNQYVQTAFTLPNF